MNNNDIFINKIYRNKVIKNEIDRFKNQFPDRETFKSKKELLDCEKRDYILSIIISFDEELLEGDIPTQIKSIYFTSSYKKEIKANVIPHGCVNLTLPYFYNEIIEPNVLPSSIKYLNLGFYYNQELTNLPHSLKELILSSNFNQELTGIPSTVETLEINRNFNKAIKPNQLPKSLKSLTLGLEFNHSLSNALPSGLESLTLGYNFNQEISIGDLPSNLKYFCTGLRFNKELVEGVLPQSLETLIILKSYSFGVRVPLGVKRLEIDNIASFIQNGSTIPSSVTELSVGMPNIDVTIPSNFIPHSVKSLSFRTNFAAPIQKGLIPSSVHTIIIYCRSFDQFIHIPPTVTKIIGYIETKNRLKRNNLIPATAKYISIQQYRHENGESDSEGEYTDEEDEN